MGTDERRVDLVFEGGVKGIALAGAFAELDSRDKRGLTQLGDLKDSTTIEAVLPAAGHRLRPEELPGLARRVPRQHSARRATTRPVGVTRPLTNESRHGQR